MHPQTRIELANDIVNKIRNDLNSRAGFDHWWDPIPEDIKKDIHADLVVVVGMELAKNGS